MSPRIMCHQHSISESDREFIKGKIDKLKKIFDRITEVSVILDSAKHQCNVEILLYGPHLNLRVQDKSDDMRTAFEGALKKAERWLRKSKERMYVAKKQKRNVTIRRFGSGGPAEPAAGAENHAGALREPHSMEEVEPKPMSLEEAHLQMHTRKKGLLVFLNAETNEINILHRNAENQVELVELDVAEASLYLEDQPSGVSVGQSIS
jgi:putative sigma-54 modulation protein